MTLLKRVCRQCSTLAETEKDFCPECGTKYFQETTREPRPRAQAGATRVLTPKVSNGKATASMVCGIIGIVVFGLILGIIAIALGSSAKREMAQDPWKYSNSGAATAGQVLGIIDVVAGVLILWWLTSIDVIVFF